MRHCNVAVPKNTSYKVRVIVNSNVDQGSVQWRSDYYRFVGKSYAHVLKNGVNTNAVLSNHSDKIVCHSPPEKHAVNRVTWASSVYNPESSKPKTVKCKSYHDPILRVNNHNTVSRDHIANSEEQYYVHEDGMVFSTLFSKNKFSLLENNALLEGNDNSDTGVDTKCQTNTVMSGTRKKPVLKVSVDSNVTKNCVIDTVVSPVTTSRHKTVTSTTRNQVSSVDSYKGNKNYSNEITPSQDGVSDKKGKNTDISLAESVTNNSNLATVVGNRHKIVSTANDSQVKVTGLGEEQLHLTGQCHNISTASNRAATDGSLYSNNQKHSIIPSVMVSRLETVTGSKVWHLFPGSHLCVGL